MDVRDSPSLIGLSCTRQPYQKELEKQDHGAQKSLGKYQKELEKQDHGAQKSRESATSSPREPPKAKHGKKTNIHAATDLTAYLEMPTPTTSLTQQRARSLRKKTEKKKKDGRRGEERGAEGAGGNGRGGGERKLGRSARERERAR